MRLTVPIVLCVAVALTGCYEQDTTLDTSDSDRFEASVTSMRAELSPPRADALGEALLTLAFPQAHALPAATAAPKAPDAVTAFARDPVVLVSRLGPQADGLTAAEIIDAARTYKLTSIDSELTRLRHQTQKWSGYASAAATLLRMIDIRSPRYYWHTNDGVKRAVIDFTIANDSPIAVKRVVVLGNLQSPEREVPWVRSTFTYTFPGGLEPGETQRLKLLADTFGDWSQDALRTVTDAALTLSVINVRDAYDTPLIPVEVERLDDMRTQIAGLEAERDALMTARP